jgi:hypothetical protein
MGPSPDLGALGRRSGVATAHRCSWGPCRDPIAPFLSPGWTARGPCELAALISFLPVASAFRADFLRQPNAHQSDRFWPLGGLPEHNARRLFARAARPRNQTKGEARRLPRPSPRSRRHPVERRIRRTAPRTCTPWSRQGQSCLREPVDTHPVATYLGSVPGRRPMPANLRGEPVVLPGAVASDITGVRSGRCLVRGQTPTHWPQHSSDAAPLADAHQLGAVAQLGEHKLCKLGVEGSSPFRST